MSKHCDVFLHYNKTLPNNTVLSASDDVVNLRRMKTILTLDVHKNFQEFGTNKLLLELI
jgi:hypothetical protein